MKTLEFSKVFLKTSFLFVTCNTDDNNHWEINQAEHVKFQHCILLSLTLICKLVITLESNSLQLQKRI